MERKNRYDGLHPAAVSSIRHHASCLAGVNAVPGMDKEDYQQELALHILRRIGQHDERRGSLPTFFDRILDNRSKCLVAPTKAKLVERRMLSLDEPAESTDEDEIALQNLISTGQSLWPASRLSPSEQMDLRVELDRFVRDLSPGGRRCLDWLLAGGVEAAICNGVHRSSFYDALERLRSHAHLRGLEEYLREQPDFLPTRWVSNEQIESGPSTDC